MYLRHRGLDGHPFSTTFIDHKNSEANEDINWGVQLIHMDPENV